MNQCVCVCVSSISQLSSWPPYATPSAQATSICRVNAQSQPQAAGPYKPHYSSRNPAEPQIVDTRRHTWLQTDTLDRPRVSRTPAKSPDLGEVFLKFIIDVWTGVR